MTLKSITKAIDYVTDPQKVLTPPASLFLSRAHCYLSTSRPLLALSDANKALKLDKECLPAKITKAESLYHLLMIEKSLMMFTRLIKEKPDNRAAKMGRAKCCQAIENSIAEDCFDVPNIEDIFQSTFTKDQAGQSFPTSYEVPPTNRKIPNEKGDTVVEKEQRGKYKEETEKKEKTKEEAKDFLGPLRFLYEWTKGMPANICCDILVSLGEFGGYTFTKYVFKASLFQYFVFIHLYLYIFFLDMILVSSMT